MQAADIDDWEFLNLVAAYNLDEDRWALVWDMQAYFDVPFKVIRAKARKLLRRGLMDGCHCGCRGDFEVIDSAERRVLGWPEIPLKTRMPFLFAD